MIQTLPQPDAVARWLHATVGGTLRCDSRQLQPGDGFIAWPGAATDGRRFVADALAAGAAAAVVERDGLEAFDLNDGRVLAVPGLKAQAGPIASAFYAEPSAGLDVVAFTGTNGKTSSAWWMAQLLSAVGRPCALVGTLGEQLDGNSSFILHQLMEQSHPFVWHATKDRRMSYARQFDRYQISCLADRIIPPIGAIQ